MLPLIWESTLSTGPSLKKIDLHIHTKTSSQDKDFVFSEDNLKRYVRDAEIDCIAITNHNLFDRAQFEKITSRAR